MTEFTENDAYDLLRAIGSKEHTNFSGLGIIFYRELRELVFADLGQDRFCLPKVPIDGLNTVSALLSDLATANSPWHDGFHLFNVGGKCLTHISQFIIPPQAELKNIVENARPFGARSMTAFLVSGLPEVALVLSLIHI